MVMHAKHKSEPAPAPPSTRVRALALAVLPLSSMVPVEILALADALADLAREMSAPLPGRAGEVAAQADTLTRRANGGPSLDSDDLTLLHDWLDRLQLDLAHAEAAARPKEAA